MIEMDSIQVVENILNFEENVKILNIEVNVINLIFNIKIENSIGVLVKNSI